VGIVNATAASAALLFLCTCGIVWGQVKAATPPAPAPPEWVQLFNGKDLTGWKKVGEAKWTVEEGILIGQQDDGKVGDLLTQKEYADFDLVVTFKVMWPANSGIWFRKPEKKLGLQFDILDLKEYKVATGSVYGSLPLPKEPEAPGAKPKPGAGFVSKNTDESMLKKDDWNEAEIIAKGPHIIVKLNGKVVGEFDDEQYTTGAIGFQVHGGEKYRNMKILVKEAKLKPL
jgi:hypothetical protein